MDTVTRDDGRYLLYYSWPDPSRDTEPAPAVARDGPAETEPWTPEVGPASSSDV